MSDSQARSRLRTSTPTLQMLWETADPAEILSTRFHLSNADDAARRVTDLLWVHWGVTVSCCDRIVLSDHNALAWVTTPAGRMILKWSVAPDRFPRLQALSRLTTWLDSAGLPVSPPVPTLDGRLHLLVGGNSIGLQRHIDGELLDPSQPAQVRKAGVTLSRLHHALARYLDVGRIPDLTAPASPLSDQLSSWLDRHAAHVPPTVLGSLRQVSNQRLPDPGPAQIVHGDYRSANLIADDTQIRAVLDFEEVRIDYRIAELARSAVLLGTRFRHWEPVPVDVHRAFFDSYQDCQQLTSIETRWWKPLLLWSSLQMAAGTHTSSAWWTSVHEQLRGSGDSRA